jgi:hypothetical protein
MKLKKLQPFDASGKRIHVGDLVRVIGCPKKVRGHRSHELNSVFAYLVGRYRRVSDFDKFGHLIICFRVPSGIRKVAKGWHSVALEPQFVRIKRPRL